MAIENDSSVRALVRRTLDAPDDAREAVPALLSALDHPDPAVRAGIGWAICAVAAAHPDDAPGIVGRLDGRHGHTAAMAAGWIRRELDVDGSDRDAPDGRPPRSAADRTDEDTTAGDAVSKDPQPGTRPDRADADAPDEAEPSERTTAEPPEETTATDPSDERTAADSSEEATIAEPSSQRPDENGRATGGSEGPVRERPDRVVRNGTFTIELDRTALDALEIVERVASDRHSWTYAGIAGVDAERRAVLVRTYRPPQGARLSTFASAFEEIADDWDGVDAHENVLTVHDYGRRPHPWVVTGYAPRTLGSIGRLPVDAALRVGLDAAKGLGHAHQRGVTHRSLDPRSIALDSQDGRAVARLANLGIVDAFRAVDGPLPLDSRYAAPELFDAEHGGVDWLTDVYHLGAVLYTAFSGRPPYDRSLVARGGPVGLSYEPPSSVVESVPVAVDRIVAKAMATHKIARYESADEFARDLQSALAEVEDGTR